MINVIPENDEREHIHSTDCWCCPRIEWQHPTTGEIYANGPIILHNSADCRELVENLLDEGCGPMQCWATDEEISEEARP
jgi:hypothetical protein